MFNLESKPDKDYETCPEWNLLFIDVSVSFALLIILAPKSTDARQEGTDDNLELELLGVSEQRKAFQAPLVHFP
jgi:hypothetical protein